MLRKLFLVLLGCAVMSPAFAFSWWVPGHYQGDRWVGGHVRGQAGYLSPHYNFNYRTGTWHFIPGHYVRPY